MSAKTVDGLTLPRYSSLYDDMFVMSGKTDATGTFVEYSHRDQIKYRLSHAERMAEHLRGWLPSQLESAGLPSRITEYDLSDVTDVDEYHSTAHYYLEQRYGELPSKAMLEQGKILEVAGPTFGEDSLVERYGIQPDVVTNIDPVPYQLEEAGYLLETGSVDVVSNAAAVPFGDGSFETVYISCLPGAPRQRTRRPEWETLRDDAIAEAARVLKSGGRLLWYGGTTDDFDTALHNHLQPEYVETELSVWLAGGVLRGLSLDLNGVFLKHT